MIRRRTCFLVLITVAAVVMLGINERKAKLSPGGMKGGTKSRQEETTGCDF